MRLKIISLILYFIIMLVGKLSRNKYINKEIRDKFEKEKKIPIIYAFWHNRIFYLAYLYRKTNVGIMVSKHKDGEMITMVMKKLGLTAIRGSTTRGGIRALIEIIRYARNTNNSIAFTPDGPKGPKYTIQEGILIAARETGYPIVPVTWYAKRKIIFNSWDNFIFPLPFNKFTTIYGNPIFVSKKDNIERKKQELRAELIRITDLSEET